MSQVHEKNSSKIHSTQKGLGNVKFKGLFEGYLGVYRTCSIIGRSIINIGGDFQTPERVKRLLSNSNYRRVRLSAGFSRPGPNIANNWTNSVMYCTRKNESTTLHVGNFAHARCHISSSRKKRNYMERCLYVEHATFTPLIVGTTVEWETNVRSS